MFWTSQTNFWSFPWILRAKKDNLWSLITTVWILHLRMLETFLKFCFLCFVFLELLFFNFFNYFRQNPMNYCLCWHFAVDPSKYLMFSETVSSWTHLASLKCSKIKNVYQYSRSITQPFAPRRPRPYFRSRVRLMVHLFPYYTILWIYS